MKNGEVTKFKITKLEVGGDKGHNNKILDDFMS